MLIKTIKLLCLALLVTAWSAFAQNSAVVGKWKTIDDKTGQPKAIVQIYEQGGLIYGKITQLFLKHGEDPNPVCVGCTGKRKGQKVIGMVVLEGLKKQSNEWSGGTIFDPNNGKTYKCKIWLENGKLKVRGYIAFFFRTQTWHK